MKNSWKVSEISAQRRTSLAVSDIPPVPGGRGTLGSWASEHACEEVEENKPAYM